MKRFTLVLLTVLLVFSLFACSDGGKDEKIPEGGYTLVGSWVREFDGGPTTRYEFLDDGTGFIHTTEPYDKSTPIKYEYDGSKVTIHLYYSETEPPEDMFWSYTIKGSVLNVTESEQTFTQIIQTFTAKRKTD